MNYEAAAKYWVDTFGTDYIMGGDNDNEILGFICPECGEPIYFEDWTDNDTKNWTICPICEFNSWEGD